MLPKWYAFGIAGAIGILVGLSIVSLEGRAAQVSQPVTNQPFTVSMAYFGLLGDATTTPPQTKLFARNSRGSTVEVRPALPRVQAGNRIITNQDSRVAIDVVTESMTTYKLRNSPTVEQNCSHSGVRDEILGVEVFKRETTQKLTSNRSIRLEQWIAPSLACFTLREIKTQFENGFTKSTNTAEAVSISVGEPPGELFEIPLSYVERSPSQVFAEVARRRPDICTQCAKNPAALDEAYFKSR